MAFFTTHSPIETYKQCPMLRYLAYHHLGTGIRPKARSIPLSTGAEIHTGVTYLLDIVRQLPQTKLSALTTLPESEISMAVTLALCNYMDAVEGKGFLQPNTSDEQTLFTYYEQKSLIEALIRVWAIVELPIIMQYYTVLEVEKEIPYPLPSAFKFDGQIILGSRADAILQKKAGKEITVYSLKTIKQWDQKRERSYRKDTQCVTETEAVRYWLEQRAKRARGITETILWEQFDNQPDIPKLHDIYNYLKTFTTVPQTIGVQFCYLLKGQRREDKIDGSKSSTETESHSFDSWRSNRTPLLSCFVKHTPSGIEFAHTNKVVKPENVSGFGLLGKGWSEQYVWECEALGVPEERVKNWVNMLPKLQPALEERLGRVLDKCYVRPLEVFVSPERAERTLHSISDQESAIRDALAEMGDDPTLDDIEFWFPKNEHRCHWPEHCIANPICWSEEIYSSSPFHVSLESVLESGFYERRESHYKLESIYREEGKKDGKSRTESNNTDTEQTGDNRRDTVIVDSGSTQPDDTDAEGNSRYGSTEAEVRREIETE